MPKLPNQNQREPLTVGDVYLMTLANGMFSACRVLYKVEHSQPEYFADAWMVVACDWFGAEPPPLDHPSLRRSLRLTHHYHAIYANRFVQAELTGPVPDEFQLIGNLPPTLEETTPSNCQGAGWHSLPKEALDQWRWEHERDGVLAEDAIKAAEFKAQQAEWERQQMEALKTMTYAQFRDQRLFPD